jgi:hypothetical protein
MFENLWLVLYISKHSANREEETGLSGNWEMTCLNLGRDIDYPS